jgi:hypothetical protein
MHMNANPLFVLATYRLIPYHISAPSALRQRSYASISPSVLGHRRSSRTYPRAFADNDSNGSCTMSGDKRTTSEAMWSMWSYVVFERNSTSMRP